MSDYVDKLRLEKKTELSQKVSLSLVDDIWCMSYVAVDAEEFIDYLMTITNKEAIEEFFNKCHDQGGRFCGGPSAGGGPARGPGTHRPAPIDYIKQQVREKSKITGARASSSALSKVTTSPVRRIFDLASGGLGLNPSGFGTVKLHRLQKANLSDFGTEDLKTLKTRLEASQRQYNYMNSMGWTTAATALATAAVRSQGSPVIAGALLGSAAYSIGVSRWKTKRIPAQIEKIDRTLARRSKLSSDNQIELAMDDSNLPTLAQEIAAAKKEIESGKFPKAPKLSASNFKEVENLLSDIDDDDDLTPEQIKGIKAGLAEYKKSVK